MNDNRKKIGVGFAIFMAGMLLLTLISKGIYAAGLPQVTVELPKKASLVHQVKAVGNVIQGRELAVNVSEGLRVYEVFVRPGDRVEEGDALFVLDMDYLQEMIGQREVEIEKLRLQIATLDHNLQLEGSQKNREMERANEDGLWAVEEAERSLARALEDEALARERLEAHLKNGVERTSDADRKRQEEDYYAWEDRVSDAAGNSAQTQENVRRLEEWVSVLEKEVDWLRGQTGEVSGNDIGTAEELGQKEAELDQARKDLEKARSASDAAAGDLTDLQKGAHILPDFTAEDVELEAWEGQLKALQEQVRQAERALEDALSQREELLREARRKQEDSTAPERTDATLGLYQMDYARQAAELETLREYQKSGGKILAGMQGEITQVRVQPGEKTGSGAALLYADTSEPLQFMAQIDKDQKKYVEQGREAAVTLNNKKYEVTVDYLSADENGTGSYSMRINLPENVGTIGQSGEFTLSMQSETYMQCISLDALHQDEMGRYYVYILSERSTVLGKELTAERLMVELLDQNERTAAVSSGGIDESTLLIVSATKAYQDGDVVRLRD